MLTDENNDLLVFGKSEDGTTRFLVEIDGFENKTIIVHASTPGEAALIACRELGQDWFGCLCIVHRYEKSDLN